ASANRTAWVWEATTGKPLLTLLGHSAPVLSAAFSPDGTRIVTASKDRTARVFFGSLPGYLRYACTALRPFVLIRFDLTGDQASEVARAGQPYADSGPPP